ncbi:OmpH family outer membrane protein [Singulisphaera sp. PoT]|uniref:OmpH family outer membrane protein n=1 Tax=Singulisphaera sp. PoT TaxID=3411797 RepID=UPI003BF4B047
MVVSSRLFIAAGLSFVGVGLLISSSFGQDKDAAVRKTATRAAGASTPPPAPAPPVFGSVDVGAVFKGYDKVRVVSEEFRSSVMNKRNEIMKYAAEMQTESEKLARLTPGSVDAKKIESHLTELKAKGEAERESAERDFSMREAEMLATVYKEIQTMVSRVAKYRGMTYVLRVSNDPITNSDPRSAMTAVERTVVYADPTNDITKMVITQLNAEYKAASGGAIPQPAASPAQAPAAASTTARPRGN